MAALERVVKFLVWVWTILVGLPCLAGLFFHDRNGGAAALLLLPVGFAPLAGLIWFGQARKARWARIHAGMLAEVGVGAGDYEHGEDDSGIAINRGARTITLLHAGSWTYAFSDVRRRETSSVKAGAIVGGNLTAATAALGANLAAAIDAKAQSGLFVEVRDVDRAKWRVAMRDERQQARWMEILRQEINEGHAAAQPAHA